MMNVIPIILAASNGGGGIFIVLVLIIWAISSLANLGKKNQQKGQQQRPRPIVFEPPPTAPQMPNRPMVVMPPKLNVAAKKTVIRQKTAVSAKPKAAAVAGQQLATPLQGVVEQLAKPAVAAPVIPVGAPVKRRFDLDARALRKQIVMIEVLGKPVALREEI